MVAAGIVQDFLCIVNQKRKQEHVVMSIDSARRANANLIASQVVLGGRFIIGNVLEGNELIRSFMECTYDDKREGHYIWIRVCEMKILGAWEIMNTSSNGAQKLLT